MQRSVPDKKRKKKEGGWIETSISRKALGIEADYEEAIMRGGRGGRNDPASGAHLSSVAALVLRQPREQGLSFSSFFPSRCRIGPMEGPMETLERRLPPD